MIAEHFERTSETLIQMLLALDLTVATGDLSLRNSPEGREMAADIISASERTINHLAQRYKALLDQFPEDPLAGSKPEILDFYRNGIRKIDELFYSCGGLCQNELVKIYFLHAVKAVQHARIAGIVTKYFRPGDEFLKFRAPQMIVFDEARNAFGKYDEILSKNENDIHAGNTEEAIAYFENTCQQINDQCGPEAAKYYAAYLYVMYREHITRAIPQPPDVVAELIEASKKARNDAALGITNP